MVVKLPSRLYSLFLQERLREIRTLRELSGVDRRLLARMTDAVEAGLPFIETCEVDEYAGPYVDLVRRAEALPPEDPIEVSTSSGDTRWSSVLGVAEAVVEDESSARPNASGLRWLVIGYSVPRCANDSNADLFGPVVRADVASVIWHVAASLFTWSQCGVLTTPLLAETLREWSRQGIAVEAWFRDHERGDDPYAAFMAALAMRALEGDVGAPSRDDYFSLIARAA